MFVRKFTVIKLKIYFVSKSCYTVLGKWCMMHIKRSPSRIETFPEDSKLSKKKRKRTNSWNSGLKYFISSHEVLMVDTDCQNWNARKWEMSYRDNISICQSVWNIIKLDLTDTVKWVTIATTKFCDFFQKPSLVVWMLNDVQNFKHC